MERNSLTQTNDLFNKVISRCRGNTRSDFRARCGRTFEALVNQTLQSMEAAGLIGSFVYNPPLSKADREGKDFTVWIEKDGRRSVRLFGVTISSASQKILARKYPEIPQIYFKWGTSPEVIRSRILSLFS